jgi:hypothetical protein
LALKTPSLSFYVRFGRPAGLAWARLPFRFLLLRVVLAAYINQGKEAIDSKDATISGLEA